MKTWKPGTCACTVEEIYSGSTITGMGAVVTKCPQHTAVADADLYGVLIANSDSEGKRHCGVLRTLLGHDNATLNLGLTTTDADGMVVFKSGIEYSWSFTGTGASRVLNVSVVGVTLTSAKKAALQAAIDSAFGSGKILVV